MNCNTCNQDLSEDNFSFKSQRLGTKQTKCKLCTRQYAQAHYGKNKAVYKKRAKTNSRRYFNERRAFLDWLREVPCADCDIVFDPICMDFDHLHDKNFDISSAPKRGLSVEKLMCELAKCEVVCSNCHRKRTRNRKMAL